jgi:hypothetical protein
MQATASGKGQNGAVAVQRKLTNSTMLVRSVDISDTLEELGKTGKLATPAMIKGKSKQSHGVAGKNDPGGGHGGDNPSPANGSVNYSINKGGGLIMKNANVHLLFWGRDWSSSSNQATLSTVVNQLDGLFYGPFFSELSQYGFHDAHVADAHHVNSDPPASPQGTDYANVIISMLSTGQCPPLVNDSNYNDLYVIVPLSGAGGSNSPNTWAGFHNYYTANLPFGLPSQDVYYATLGYNGGVDLITLGLSHELAESFTDPAGTGIQLSPATEAPNWTEISDACENQTNVVDGVDVQKYWSENAKACVMPTKPNSRVPAGSKRTLAATATFKITGGQGTQYVSTGNFTYQENASVDNNKTSNILIFATDSVGAVAANLFLSLNWKSDLSVKINFNSNLFIGGPSNANWGNEFTAQPGETWTWTIDLWSAGNVDTCHCVFSITNNQG